MIYKKYGKNGPKISRLGFGVMRLPARKQGDWGSVNYTRSVEVLRAAMEAGVNFLDTHHNYHHGKSEIAIGKALKGWKGQRIFIQTKTPWYRKEPLDHFKKLLYDALEKLGVNQIDYLLHHSMNMQMWKQKGRSFIRFTDWAMRRGLICHRGFSTHDTPENVKRFIDTGEFAACLISYNWMNPRMRDTVAYAASKGMGVTIMNPLGGGTLAARTPQIMRLLPGAKSPAEIGLRYVLATPGVAAALSGMNRLDEVAENVRAASRKTPMTTKQKRHMKARLAKITAEQKRFCTGCGYCMPCEHGVNIPLNFRSLNEAKFFGLLDHARARYARLKNHRDGDKSAEACVRCGKCEPKCPIGVPIMDQLEEVARTLG